MVNPDHMHANRMNTCHYYNWKTITGLEYGIQNTEYLRDNMHPSDLQSTSGAGQAQIDLSTFPPLCIPAHSWFSPGLPNPRIVTQMNTPKHNEYSQNIMNTPKHSECMNTKNIVDTSFMKT